MSSSHLPNAKVKLNLNRLSIEEKLPLAQRIITALTGNATFPQPKPTLPQLQALLTNATNAVNVYNLAVQTAEQRRSECDTASHLFQQLSAEVPLRVRKDGTRIQWKGQYQTVTDKILCIDVTEINNHSESFTLEVKSERQMCG